MFPQTPGTAAAADASAAVVVSNDVDAASVVPATPPLTLAQSLMQGYYNTQPHTGRLSEPRLGLASAAAGQTMLFAGGEGRGKRLSATVDLYMPSPPSPHAD
jgi:hypothetical protein